MQPAEAIGILRSLIGPSSVLHREIAENMGADALEFQAWFFHQDKQGGCRFSRLWTRWNGEDSFLDFALGEWRKEMGNG